MKNELNKKEVQLENTNFDVFESKSLYVNCLRMYFAYYKAIPNVKEISNVDIEAILKWLRKEFENQIVKEHFKQYYNSEEKVLFDNYHFYFLNNGILLNIERESIYVLFTEKQEYDANQLFEKFKKFIKKPKKCNQQLCSSKFWQN